MSSIVRPEYYQSVSSLGRDFLIAACPGIDKSLGLMQRQNLDKLCDRFGANAPRVKHPSLLSYECRIVQKFLEANKGWRHAELTAIKYLWRAGDKGDALDDLRKAKFYFSDSWEPERFDEAIAMLRREIFKLGVCDDDESLMHDYESKLISRMKSPQESFKAQYEVSWT